MSELEARLVEAGLRSGMTEEEARQAAADSVRRRDWRLRRGGKECASCEDWKPVADFGVDSRERDGRHRVCRSCRSIV